MMKTSNMIIGLLLVFLVISSQANAELWSVSGPASSSGVGPAIISAPSAVLDNNVTNLGMQGFDERQGMVLPADLSVDSGVIGAGTTVDSHMIFLNSEGTAFLSHYDVVWTFSRPILGVMSDTSGSLEVNSSALLGAVGTTYPAASFPNRGMEGGDFYTILTPNTLEVNMAVTEPGDWIRVITGGPVVPVPGAALLGMLGLSVAGIRLRKHA